jgi:hypothetical protein
MDIPCLEACVIGSSVDGRCDTALNQEGIRFEVVCGEGVAAELSIVRRGCLAGNRCAEQMPRPGVRVVGSAALSLRRRSLRAAVVEHCSRRACRGEIVSGNDRRTIVWVVQALYRSLRRRRWSGGRAAWRRGEELFSSLRRLTKQGGHWIHRPGLFSAVAIVFSSEFEWKVFGLVFDFVLQQPAFSLDASAVACERTIGPDDAMTGDDYSDGVGAVG